MSKVIVNVSRYTSGICRNVQASSQVLPAIYYALTFGSKMAACVAVEGLENIGS